MEATISAYCWVYQIRLDTTLKKSAYAKCKKWCAARPSWSPLFTQPVVTIYNDHLAGSYPDPSKVQRSQITRTRTKMSYNVINDNNTKEDGCNQNRWPSFPSSLNKRLESFGSDRQMLDLLQLPLFLKYTWRSSPEKRRILFTTGHKGSSELK